MGYTIKLNDSFNMCLSGQYVSGKPTYWAGGTPLAILTFKYTRWFCFL